METISSRIILNWYFNSCVMLFSTPIRIPFGMLLIDSLVVIGSVPLGMMAVKGYLVATENKHVCHHRHAVLGAFSRSYFIALRHCLCEMPVVGYPKEEETDTCMCKCNVNVRV